MSRWDIPITYLIRYIDVARLQLSHFYRLDTTPRARCLCDCPLCVTVNVTTCALVTFHTDRVCTVQQRQRRHQGHEAKEPRQERLMV
jgi:hypothetical protein